MKRIHFLIFIMLTILTSLLYKVFPAISNELTAEDILENLKTQFTQINDYQVDITVETDIPQVRIPRMKAKLFFKQPNKTHIESNGFVMLPREGVFINPNMFNSEEFYMSVMLSMVNTIKLELVPRKEETRFRKIILWIDPIKWTIVRINSISLAGQTIDVSLTYGQFSELWLPTEVLVSMDISGFRGFSGFHGDYNRTEDKKNDSEKGRITIKFYNYRINEGIPDSIFEPKEEEINW